MTYQLTVEKMSCGHCVRAVTEAVREVDADAAVQVDLGAGAVRVDSAASLERVRAAIVEAGFPVTAATATA